MAEIKTEIVINRPLEEVFKFLVFNIMENLPKIETTILMIEQLTDGEVKKGTQFHLIISKHEGDQDLSKSDKIKDLDLDTLEPELRKEVEETFIEVTAFEKDKLLEFIRVGEGNKKLLERFNFENENSATKLIYCVKFNLSDFANESMKNGKGVTNFFKPFLKLLIKPLFKLSLNERLKNIKAVIEAEADLPQSEPSN